MKTAKIIILTTILLCVSCSKEEVIQEPFEDHLDLSLISESDWTLAQEILDGVNLYRLSVELPPIIMNKQMASILAIEHSKDMILQSRISHDNFPYRSSKLKGHGAKSVGENVASGYKTSGDLVNAWIQSPSHKRILEGNFTHSGMGVLRDQSGKIYVTHLFYRK